MIRYFKFWGGTFTFLFFLKAITILIKLTLANVSQEKTFEYLTPNYTHLISVLNYSSIAIDIFIILLSLVISAWFIFDFRSGQVSRDIHARSLGRYLLRFIATNQNNQMKIDEESQANHFVLRCKIIEKNGSLLVMIPCGNYAAVCESILDRCSKANVVGWLHEQYPTLNWKQPEKETSLFGNQIVIRQK